MLSGVPVAGTRIPAAVRVPGAAGPLCPLPGRNCRAPIARIATTSTPPVSSTSGDRQNGRFAGAGEGVATPARARPACAGSPEAAVRRRRDEREKPEVLSFIQSSSNNHRAGRATRPPATPSPGQRDDPIPASRGPNGPSDVLPRALLAGRGRARIAREFHVGLAVDRPAVARRGDDLRSLPVHDARRRARVQFLL